jgi:type 1 glutamine amidotransferase
MIARLGRLLAALIATAVPACGDGPTSPDPPPTSQAPTTPPAARARVLVVTHTAGFRHSSIPIAESVIEQLGRTSGVFDVTFCRTASDVTQQLTVASLQSVDAVVFANTTGNLGIPDVRAFLDWIAAGHGFAAMHSGSDTYHDEPSYLAMLGNEFRTHGDQTEVNALVENTSHPAVSSLGERFRIFDEIYRFTRNNRGEVTMLLSLDQVPRDGLPDAGQPGDLPLAWAKPHGSGRVFYTALGHREEVWQDSRFQQHVLGGLRWVLQR